MIQPDHECWWTRKRRSHVAWRDQRLTSMGVPRSAIVAVARRLGFAPVEDGNPVDEYGVLMTFGPWSAAVHDGCFASLQPANRELIDAYLAVVLEVHEYYLRSTFPLAALSVLQAHLRVGQTIEVWSDTRRHELRIPHYPNDAGWWARRRAVVESVRIAGDHAR